MVKNWDGKTSFQRTVNCDSILKFYLWLPMTFSSWHACPVPWHATLYRDTSLTQPVTVQVLDTHSHAWHPGLPVMAVIDKSYDSFHIASTFIRFFFLRLFPKCDFCALRCTTNYRAEHHQSRCIAQILYNTRWWKNCNPIISVVFLCFEREMGGKNFNFLFISISFWRGW